MSATHAIEKANVQASTTNAVPGPPVATIHPPSAGPSIRRAAGRTSWSSEFAWFSSASGTRPGTIASNAGPKNAVPAPNSPESTNICQSSSRPESARAPNAPTATARIRSAAIITLRRSNRSEATPPASRNTTCGTVIATPIMESAVGVFESS
jgi:hypothetical protein